MSGRGYVTVQKASTGLMGLYYDPVTFSTKVSSWTNLARAQVTVYPELESSGANLIYTLESIEEGEARMIFHSGGST